MFGAIPGNILMDILKSEGYMEQLSFDFPPVIDINEECLTDVPLGYSFNGRSHMGATDHPAFAELRNNLESSGYVETRRNYSNGDFVIKPFYLNGKYFDEYDQFPCAAAMKNNLK
jgi:hypothetical protein